MLLKGLLKVSQMLLFSFYIPHSFRFYYITISGIFYVRRMVKKHMIKTTMIIVEEAEEEELRVAERKI